MKKPIDIGITDDMSILEAKVIMRSNLQNGFMCPCCSAPTKSYRRTITAAMAYGLILLYTKGCDHSDTFGYLHIENFFKALVDVPASIRADIPKLRFWNLIEPKPGDTEDGNPSNGYYRLTWLGREFVNGKQPVQKLITIYNNKRIGHVNEAGTINITQALKNKFNYEKLMKGEL